MRSERGITLTEVTITMVLATLVMAGLVGFYLNSQAVWVDGSTQAIAQREATLLLERIAREGRRANAAIVADFPDTSRQKLSFVNDAGLEYAVFWSDPVDSLVMGTFGEPGVPGEPERLTTTAAVRLQFETFGTRRVDVRRIELRSGRAGTVRLQSSVALYNAPAGP